MAARFPRRTVLTAMLAVAAAACHRSRPPGYDGNDGTGQITFVSGRDVTVGGQIGAIVQDWNRTHANEQVTFIELPGAADLQRSQMAAVEQVHSSRYDVLNLDIVWIAAFADSGWLLPLDPDRFHLGDFLPAWQEAVQRNGELWAVPFNADVGLLYYRKDLVGASRRDPASWDELAATASSIRNADPGRNLAGYLGQFKQYEGLTVNAMEAVWGAGGRMLSADGNKVSVDSSPARRGLEFLLRGFREGWIPRDALDYDEARGIQQFREGRAVFLRNWPYARKSIDSEGSQVRGDNLGVTTLPGNRPALGGQALAISRFCRNQQTARRFIDHLTEKQADLYRRGGLPPTLTDLYGKDDRDKDRFLDVLWTAVQGAQARPATPSYEEVTTVVQQEVHDALQDATDPVQPSPEELADLLVGALTDKLPAATRGKVTTSPTTTS
jgi:multiple sugar transport system substrate-binding protein